MARTKDQVAGEIVRILRALKTLPDTDRERHAILARDLATTMVELREHYLTPEGQPDWTGRTWAYRNAVRELYHDGAYNAEERASTQASVRYHIGNIIRHHLTSDELEAAGITAPAPLQRQANRRARTSALLAAIAVDEDRNEPVTNLVALRDALAMMVRLRLDKHHPVTPDAYAAAEATALVLVAIRERAASLLGELRTLGVTVDE